MSTKGLVYDRISFTWVTPEEMRNRQLDREEMAFRMGRNQGELCCPMIISDTMDPIQSMLDGKMYDSKSRLRRTYKEGGVTEVGNDSSVMDPKPFKKPRPDPKKIRDSVRRAISLANLTTSSPGDDVKIKNWEPVKGPQKLYG